MPIRRRPRGIKQKPDARRKTPVISTHNADTRNAAENNAALTGAGGRVGNEAHRRNIIAIRQNKARNKKCGVKNAEQGGIKRH